MTTEYYHAYEDRYQRVYSVGGEFWGHSPEDDALKNTLTAWVKDNHLSGKRIIEFACGEGGAAVILSRLGCCYCGVDIAPSAIARARQLLSAFPDADLRVFDMVAEQLPGLYDAALDCMGIHMLVTNCHRQKYLANIAAVLRPEAPLLFYNVCHRENSYEGEITSVEEYQQISQIPYYQPRITTVLANKVEKDVDIPILPARSVSEAYYRRELAAAGFSTEKFYPLSPGWASIYARRM